ncbi:MAG: sugar ABC transporter substrate-binding protein [Treponema sp.]|nr:sugar ABC transporter substrate-binding protein [Treponema sp.]
MKRKTVKAVIITLVMITLAASAAFARGGQQGKGAVTRVGYANDDDADFFRKLARDTFENTVKNDPSINVTFTNAAADMQTQLDHINNFISQKMDVIVVQPADTAAIIPGIETANKAGIPIISIVSRSGGGRSIYVGTRYIDAGILQAQYMIKALPQNAKIVYMQGQPGFDHSRERHDGFLDTLLKARPDVSVLADQTANYDRAQGMKLMEDWIQAFPQIDGVICANDQMALGALQALRMANRESGVLIAGVDATDEAVMEVRNGGLAMTVLQSAPAIAQGAYDIIKRIVAGETNPPDLIIEQFPVTRDNVDAVIK